MDYSLRCVYDIDCAKPQIFCKGMSKSLKKLSFSEDTKQYDGCSRRAYICDDIINSYFPRPSPSIRMQRLVTYPRPIKCSFEETIRKYSKDDLEKFLFDLTDLMDRIFMLDGEQVPLVPEGGSSLKIGPNELSDINKIFAYICNIIYQE